MNLRRTNRPRKPGTCLLSPENAIAVAVILILILLAFNTFCRIGKCGPFEASVLVQAGNGGPENFAGSGTAIDKHYVITCNHVITGSSQFRVYLNAKKKWINAELAAAVRDPDIAVLYVPEELEFVELADDVESNTQLVGYGFAGSKTLYETTGNLDGTIFTNGDLSCTIDWRSGDSGGGIYIGDKFVGVGWGSSRSTTGVSNCVFAPIRRIRNALHNWCQTGRLRPSRPYFGIQIESTQGGQFCQPGSDCQPGMGCYTPENGNRRPAGTPYPDNSDNQANQQPPPASTIQKPNKELETLKSKVDEIATKVDQIGQKQDKTDQKLDELVGKLVPVEKPVITPETPTMPQNPPQIATLPNGKFRIKVNPKSSK